MQTRRPMPGAIAYFDGLHGVLEVLSIIVFILSE